MSTLVKDPVCEMDVNPDQNQATYLGMNFAFCSEQCRQRFMANPNLYIGKPGHVAPKQAGVKLIKKRRMHLAAPISIDEAGKLVEALQSMMGIKEVNVKSDMVEISYDLLEATAEQIEAQMIVIGVRIGKGWGERLRRAFVHYEEECELGNLEEGDKPCCSGRG
ncbi:MAG: YHS domain-containing protein [Sulfuricella denitrificans]|nr:YHS domain-containing protein [Sulfuricella denitrificans]